MVVVTLKDHADRLARIEDHLIGENAELRRRNAYLYLLGELQRRDALEAPRRRWWLRG